MQTIENIKNIVSELGGTECELAATQTDALHEFGDFLVELSAAISLKEATKYLEGSAKEMLAEMVYTFQHDLEKLSSQAELASRECFKISVLGGEE